MNKYSLYKYIPALLILAAGIPLQAEDKSESIVRYLSGNIKVDGILDEPDWQVEPSIANLTQVEPYPGEEPTEATKVWLAHNGDALYIAVHCEDSNPGEIVATEMKRDGMINENDNIEIVLDTKV